MRLIHGRTVKSPRKRVWLYMIQCPKCEKNGIMRASDNKEYARCTAALAWNAKQAGNLRAMNRLLNAIFGGSKNDH